MVEFCILPCMFREKKKKRKREIKNTNPARQATVFHPEINDPEIDTRFRTVYALGS